jgi:hypothetical protein
MTINTVLDSADRWTKAMTIRITRKRSYYGHLRRIIVRLDGEEVARVAEGQHVDVQGLGREQVLRLHMDWGASKPLAITDPGQGFVLVEAAMPFVLVGVFRTLWRPRTMITCRIVGSPESLVDAEESDGRPGPES